MTTLPETEQAAPQDPLTPPPSPWSAPRPDGPLAAALRLAQTQRAAGAAPSEAPHPSSPPEALEHDIEALAREAKARDDAREALAIALEWPDEGDAQGVGVRPRWMGWVALGGALVLAAVAAAIAVSFAPAEALLQPPIPPSGKHGLELEKQLPLPLAPGRQASS